LAQDDPLNPIPITAGIHPAESFTVKNLLRVKRAERGWSQADLADRLEVSRQTINAIETSKYDPSLPLAFKIARVFETSIEELFDPEVHSNGLPHSGNLQS
jgi:putative transcriptional regulator